MNETKIAEQVEREIKRIGDNMTELKRGIEKDFADLKTAHEEGKTEHDTEIKALQESVLAKQEAFENSMSEMSEKVVSIQTAMARRKFSGADDEAKEAKNALSFKLQCMQFRGELKVGNRPGNDDVDVDEFKAYGGAIDLYLRKDDRALDPAQVKALSVGSDPDGGYLVTPAMASVVTTKVYETSPMRELSSVQVIGSDSLEVPIDDGEANAGWVGEQQQRPETGTPRLDVQRIPVHEMYANPQATQKLLEDASVDIESWLAGKIGEKFSRLEASAFVTGDGVKKPRGILTFPNGSERGQVGQISTGHATLVTADSIKGMPFELKEPYMNRASWLMNRLTVKAVMLLKDANDQYLWRPGLIEGQPATLAGFPVRMAADMPTVAANALVAAFGDFQRAYQIVDRLGISTLRDPYTAKPFVMFYTRRRVGGDVVNFEAFKLLKVAA